MRVQNLPGRLLALASVGMLLADAGCTRREPTEIGRAGRPGVEERIAPDAEPSGTAPPATEQGGQRATDEQAPRVANGQAARVANGQTPRVTRGQAGYRPPEEAVTPSETRVVVRPQFPEEIRQGQNFTYRLQVTNESSELTLYNVVVRQQLPSGLTLESSNPPPTQITPLSRSQPQGGAVAQPTPAAQTAPAQDAPDAGQTPSLTGPAAQAPPSGQAPANGAAAQPASTRPMAEAVWTFETLEPGATRTLEITAVADQSGPLQTCFVTSHEAANCATLQVVQPELELVKQVPQTGNTCETMQFTYRVANTGTGSTGPLTLRDELGPGLRTVEGAEQIAVDVPALQAGESKEFQVEVIAIRPGPQGTRAVVTTERGDLAVRSNQALVNVQQADLAVAIDAPQVQYLDQLMNFTIRVANRGAAPAPDVRLALNPADGVTVVRAGEPSEPTAIEQPSAQQQPTQQQQAQQPQQAQQQQAQPQQAQQQQPAQQQPAQQQLRQQAPRQQAPRQRQQEAQRQEAQQRQERTAAERRQAAEPISWDIGTIPPNQEVRIEVLLRATQPGVLLNEVAALFTCGPDELGSLVRANAVARTEIQALSALLIEVIDERDPVMVEDEVNYRIVVANEGNAPDNNVQIAVEVPQELQILDASGPTQAQMQNNQLVFGPVGVLQPGETLTWQVTARALSPGDIRFTAVLRSASLTQPTRAEEPTRLFQAGQPTGGAQPGQTQPTDQQQPTGQQQPSDQQQSAGQQQPTGQQQQQFRSGGAQ